MVRGSKSIPRQLVLVSTQESSVEQHELIRECWVAENANIEIQGM